MFELLKLRVVSMTHTVLEADGVAWVQVQLSDGGLMGIFPGHTSLIAGTVTAPLRYAIHDSEHSISLEAGILTIQPGNVTVLAEECNDSPLSEPIEDTVVNQLVSRLLSPSNSDENFAEGYYE